MQRSNGDGSWRARGGLSIAAVAVSLLGLLFAAAPAMAADGEGTMTVAPTYVVSGSTGNALTFTYKASASGMTNGKLTFLVPTGWTTPNPSGFEAGGLSSLCGGEIPVVTSVAGGHLVEIKEVTLGANATCEIKYGISGFNAGDTAPVTSGPYTFTTQQSATAGGTLTNIASSPVVNVGDDGTGTMVVAPTHAVVNTSGNTLTFTYTATRTISSGQLTIAVPAGWSAPSANASAPGATTATCGTVGISGSTIQVTGINMSSAETCTIVYGNKASGPGATPSTGGIGTFTTQQEASNDNNLVALATSPKVSVTAADGAGTMTASPASVIASSTGNEIDFTFTSPTGGMNSGRITFLVPTGWTTPNSSGFEAGGLSAPCTGEPPIVTSVAGGHLVELKEVTLNEGATCPIKYGINGFNSGVTAPATEGPYTFTTQEASTSTGTLTNIASSPVILVGNDGTGTMVVSPTHAVINSTGNTLTFTYTASVSISSGQINIAVPAGWSAPSATGSAPGATTSTCGTVGASGQKIEITGINLIPSNTCTIVYGSKASGPGATAPSTGGTNTFTTQEKSSAGGTLRTLGTGSPNVIVTAADGTGTMSASPTQVITSSTGNEIDFTFTAPTGGMSGGKVTFLVPTGWTTPNSSGFEAGGLSAPCTGEPPIVTSVAGGHLVELKEVTLNEGATCPIKYGINGFNSGVTAPATEGPYTFTTQEASTATGTLTNIASSPVVNVGSDGTGTMAVAPTHAVVGSTGNTLTFTYTAAANINSGQINVAVPAGWSTPSTTGSAPGATTSTCGTVGIASSTIQVTGVNLSTAGTCTVTYGSTASGPGATAPSTGGSSTFTTQEKSSAGGTLANLGTGSPKVSVTAADGTGTMTVAPNTALNGSSKQYVFTYTAPTGGLDNGKVTIQVPAGWTAPQTGNSSGAGWVINNCGANTTISGMTIEATEVGVTEGNTCNIFYGDTFNGGPGATAPATSGPYTFTTQEASTATGTLTNIASSPVVEVDDDGTGTMTVAPTAASAGASGNTLTFTYTSVVALSSGELTVDIPAGWSAPSTTGSDPGFTTTDCSGGTVGVSGSTIQVTGISIGASANCSIVYGAKTSGGPGATSSSTPGSATFNAQEKSSSGGGALKPLATSPQLNVFAADGSGTMTPAPAFVAAGSGGNTVIFTYTAATGGISGGEIVVAVPAGWSAPSTTGGVAGYTSSTCGSVTVVSGSIHIAGVTMPAAGTCVVKYGDTGLGGTGATAPSSGGVSTFAAQEASTGFGALTAIGSSPQVEVAAPDGSGTMAVAPSTATAGSTGNTLTFTYEAAPGGLHGGELAMDVPAGWSPPSTTGSDPGFATTDCAGGTVSVAAGTIHVTGINLAGAATCKIVYGAKTSGGPGATAPSATASTFAAKEMSTASGVLSALSSSPTVSVVKAKPTLSTSASAGVPAGGGVSDKATLGAGQAPGGEIVFKLYGPDDSSCSAAPVFTKSVAVSGNGSYESGSFSPSKPGTYRWVASYSGDANNEAKSGACVESSESVVVSPPPSCPETSVRVAPYKPTERLKGKMVPGLRIKLHVESRAQLSVDTQLTYTAGGKSQTVDLGKRSLRTGRVRNLRLPLPAGLRSVLPLGTKIQLKVTVTANPVPPSPACKGPQKSVHRLSGRVAMVLAG
jgi:hypothetical protein